MVSLRVLFGTDGLVLRETGFQLLLLSNLVGPLGLAVMSPVLDSLIEPFNTSPGSIGLMISVFTAPAIVMIVVTGALADRFGRKVVLIVSLLIFGTAGSAIVLTTDFRVALLLRFVQGIAWGGLIPVIITCIGDLYDGDKEATAQGLRFTGSGLSSAVAPLLAGLLVAITWQYPFLLFAIAIPIAGILYLWFDEPSSTSSANSVSWNGSRSYVRALFALLTNRSVLAMVLARGTGTVVWIAFLTYNSIIVVRLIGGSPGQAGLLAAIGGVMFAGAASQSGRITGYFDSRLLPLIGSNFCLGIGFVIVVLAPTIYLATLGITLMGAGFGIVLSLYRSIITSQGPESLRAGLVSLAETSGRIMDTATPVVMGLLISGLTPVLGFTPAIRVAGLTAAAVGGGGGALLVVSWWLSSDPKSSDVSRI